MSTLTADKFMSLLRASNSIWHEHSGDPPKWIFRGHSDASWELRPRAWRELNGNTLEPLIRSLCDCSCPDHSERRPDREHLAHAWVHAERFVLNEFRRLAWDLGYDVQEMSREISLQYELGLFAIEDALEVDRSQISGELSGPDVALAQHYGLPTRMLDWTLNPLFAIFFAVDDLDWAAPERIANRQDMTVWALDANCLPTLEVQHGLEKRSALRMNYPKRVNNPFILAQQGVLLEFEHEWSFRYFLENGCWPSVEKYFSLALDESEFDEDGYCSYSHDHPALRKFVLPANEIIPLSFMLEDEGVTRERLMPTLESVAKAALRRVNFRASFPGNG